MLARSAKDGDVADDTVTSSERSILAGKPTGVDPRDGEGALPLPVPGDVLAGKYRVDRVLGAGGMGAVFAVTNLHVSEPFAIKILLPERKTKKDAVARFLREARSSMRMRSEHIVRVNDVGELPDGTPFLLMEYLAGKDLAQCLEERGPLPIGEAVDYVLQACAGVAEAHAIGVVHRDLKPSNLFLTARSDGTPLVKVLDFGIAKAIERPGDESALTQTTADFGSPAYMSPEQVRSAKKVDARTDIWSLGVILFELLTQSRPFHAESAVALIAAIIADEPASARARRPEIPPELEQVILACLAKKVDERIPTVAELAARILPFSRPSPASLGRIRRLTRTTATGEDAAPSVTVAAQEATAPRASDATTADAPRVPGPGRTAFVAGGLVLAAAVGAGAVFLLRDAPPSMAAAPSALPTPLPSPSLSAPPPSPSLGVAPPANLGNGEPAPRPSASSRRGGDKPRGASRPAVPSPKTAAGPPAPSPAPAPVHPPPQRDPGEDSH